MVTMLEKGEAKLEKGNGKAALAAASKMLEKDKDDADGHYLKGYCLELQHSYQEAAEEYGKALDAAPGHARAAFRMGYLMSLRGEEKEAISYYKMCTSRRPTFVNAFLNLGVLYEDTEQYEKAISCYKRVLEAEPANARARSFMKDAVGSLDMYYDEEQEKRVDRRNRIMQTPISEFELTIRSRNCLESMNIMTLGDLVRTTEVELLGYKNFGETSLNEIKHLLAERGLRLGQDLEEVEEEERVRKVLTGEQEKGDPLGKPIEEIELSVRSRRCMDMLGIKTVGGLVKKTEQELLAGKNFGQRSLEEVKDKLKELGLQLREAAAE